MNELPPEIGAEDGPDPNLSKLEVEKSQAQLEVNTLANTIVTMKASATPPGTSLPSYIIVDWQPHVHYSALSRIDNDNHGTTHVTTPITAYTNQHPVYNDHNVRSTHSYVYELFVPGNARSPFRSSPISPQPSTFHIINPPSVETPILDTNSVTVTAILSASPTGEPFIIVDWHPHAQYVSLSRVNQTSGSTSTLLNGYEAEYPPYNDWGIVSGDTYVYELYVPGNPNSPFYSPPTK